MKTAAKYTPTGRKRGPKGPIYQARHPGRYEGEQRLREGEPASAIAEIIGVTRQAVDQWRQLLGLPSPGRGRHLMADRLEQTTATKEAS